MNIVRVKSKSRIIRIKAHAMLVSLVAALVLSTDRAIAADFPAQASPGTGGAYRVVSSPYPSEDAIVVAKSAADLGINGADTLDDTAQIQLLIDEVAAMGGGVAFLEEGTYYLDGRLYLKPGVYLRGVWEKPILGKAIRGTKLAIRERHGSTSEEATIQYDDCCGILDMVIWYPNQSKVSPVSYPPAIGKEYLRSRVVTNPTVNNITFVNAYRAVSARSGVDSGTAHFNLNNLYGTPLKSGAESDYLSGNSKWTGLFFHPDYWRYSGLPGSPTDNAIANWILANGKGMQFNTRGQIYVQYAEISGYAYGGYMDGDGSDLSLYEAHFRDCGTAFESHNYKLRAVSCTFDGKGYGYVWRYKSNNNGECTFNDCVFSGGIAAVNIPLSQSQIFHSCTFMNTVSCADAEFLSIINSDFPFLGTHVAATSNNVKNVTLCGNSFQGGLSLKDGTKGCIKVDSTIRAYQPLPSMSYAQWQARKPDLKPGTMQLFNVLSYGALGDGVTDDTAAIQNALKAASSAGGGIVYIPAGKRYAIAGTLSIPAQVELRGGNEGPHFPGGDQKASLLLITGGHGKPTGTPTIAMAADSGMRGLSFYWPNQVDPPHCVGYPYLVRGYGPNIYVLNVTTANLWQGFDFSSIRCDKFYIEGHYSQTLKNAYNIGGGTVGGSVVLGQGKAYWEDVPKTIDPEVPSNDVINPFTLDNQIVCKIGNASDLLFMGNFARESHIYMQLNDQGGVGASKVITLNNGGEGTRIAYEVNALSGPLSVINSQYKVNRATRNYPQKAQYILNYSGSAIVTAFGTVMDSNCDMEAYILDGQMEIQGLRLDQQTSWSGFYVAAGASLFASGMNSQQTMPIGGAGTIDILGSKFRSSFGDSNSIRGRELFVDNAVLDYGRGAMVSANEAIVDAGINLIDTADSDQLVSLTPDFIADHDKELVYGVREAILVQGQSKEKLYLDVTNADFANTPDFAMQLHLRYYGEGSGSVAVFYDSKSGEKLLGSFTIATGLDFNEWVSPSFTDAQFANGLHGGDIRIEIDPSADFMLSSAFLLENSVYCDNFIP